MKAHKISLRHLPNAEHFQIHTEFRNLVQKNDPQALKIKPQFDAYLLLYDKVDIAYKKIVKSAITEQIQEADAARDETWRGLVDAISTALRHFDPQVRAAAKQLNIVRKTYGDVARMTYNGQTAATDNFIQDMEGPYAQHVATVGILPWVVELKARNIAFANLVRDRFDETTAKSSIVLREARAELDEAYSDICDRISALALIEGLAIYEEFIKALNTIIAKYNAVLRARLSRGKKGKEGKEAEEVEEEELEDTQTNGGSL